ncbi:MAG TPA: PQQ-binding-like beta-propeller repeat protein [Pirellulales bacterium]|nr:PQQ-binding-like beta-propeller repeat protein [Pirellulales bacterium]
MTFARDGNGETRWPRWRGPLGDGHSTDTGLPVQWDGTNIVWKTPLAGRGESSPVIWDDKLVVTTAADDGHRRSVLCLDRRDGKLLWEQSVEWAGKPEPLHEMNTFATPTCATDGEVLVAFFGRAGLHGFTLEGGPLWSKDLGPSANPWGSAASPVLVGDLVIQNADADQDSFLAAFDKRTGREAWRRPRPNRRGWSTPVVLTAGERQELVLNGHEGATAYDPASGRQLWFCKSFNGRGEPTATPAAGLVYLVNGLAGDVYAVRPGGDGDVTDSRMAWHTPRKSGRDLPSPIVVGDYLLVVSLTGVATCYHAGNGHVLWQERFAGSFSASPIAAASLAFFLSEDGTMVVVEPDREPKIVARNSLGQMEEEVFRASPAPCEGRFYLRSDRAVYCIAAGR